MTWQEYAEKLRKTLEDIDKLQKEYCEPYASHDLVREALQLPKPKLHPISEY